MNNLRRDLVDLTTQRTARLEAAQAALDAGNQADYDSAMADVRDFNGRIQNIQDLITEQDRQIMAAPAPAGSAGWPEGSPSGPFSARASPRA